MSIDFPRVTHMTRDEQDVLLGLLESFLDDSLITEVLEVVKGGKEATVFRCLAAPSKGARYFAAKVYRPMERRSFRNDGVYQITSRSLTFTIFKALVPPERPM